MGTLLSGPNQTREELAFSAASGFNLRTLHVFDTIDPTSGGPIESFRRWSDVLEKHGIVCEAVSLDALDSGFDKNLSFKITMLGEPGTSVLNRLSPDYRYSPKLVPWIRDNVSRFSCVTAHSIWTYATLGTALGLRKSNVPFIVFAHGMLDPYFRRSYPLKHLKKQAYWSLFLGKEMSNAKRVVFTAEEERDLARGCFWGHKNYKESVIGYGTADPPTASSAQLDAFHALCPATKGRRLLLFLGRIHPKKGCDILIKAFSTFAADNPDVDVVMAGPDTAGWQTTLVALAESLGVSDRIHWPGMLSDDAKWGAFRASEAFVLPSHQENFGVAVAEALACALPVLITNKVNIWREVVEAKAGLASDDNETDTEAQLRIFLSASEADRKAMSKAARQAFLKCFDVSTTALTIKDMITSLVA